MDLSLVHADKIGTGTHPPDMIFPISCPERHKKRNT